MVVVAHDELDDLRYFRQSPPLIDVALKQEDEVQIVLQPHSNMGAIGPTRARAFSWLRKQSDGSFNIDLGSSVRKMEGDED